MVGVKDKFERLNMWEAFLYDKQSKLLKTFTNCLANTSCRIFAKCL